MASKAVILYSGGLDSTTCIAIAQHQGFEPYALSFSYGQKHNIEIKRAVENAKRLGIPHKIIDLPDLGKLGGSSLTDPDLEIPDFESTGKIPSTYVPARNTIFISIALGYAEVLGAQAIFIGASNVDYSGYADCRPEYFKCWNELAALATKSGVEGFPCTIHTPLLHLSKADTIKLGVSLGVDYGQTLSCYRATPEGLACGRCDSCHYRRLGFIQAGIPDPTHYL